LIHGIKGSILSRRQSTLWLTSWQALGLASPDLRLPIHWDGDAQERDDVTATATLRTVAGQDIYDSFLKWAETSGRAFYPFVYDWRRDNLETLDQFLVFLDQVSERHSARPVQVVAHSMGGLISFVALNRRPDLFHSVLFAGVPFVHGISFLEDMHAGLATGLNKRILSPLVLFTCVSPYCFFSPFPTDSGLVQQSGDPILHDWYSADDWESQNLGIFGNAQPERISAEMRSHLRNALRRAKQFRSLLVSRTDGSFQYPPIAVLAGDAYPTISKVIRTGPRSVKGWDFQTAVKEPGDGRVIFSKSAPPDGVPYRLYKSSREHGVLLNDTSQISQILLELEDRARK
jgi:pimeloyl-ACP methyl ester carboxylesterase